MASCKYQPHEGAFDPCDLWRPSTLAVAGDPTQQSLDAYGALPSINDGHVLLRRLIHGDLKIELPSIEDFRYGKGLEGSLLPNPDIAPLQPTDTGQLTGETEEPDAWLESLSDISKREPVKAWSWERFYNPEIIHPSGRLSEVEPRAFDVALGKAVLRKNVYDTVRPVIDQHVALKSLKLLALGLSSPLFGFEAGAALLPRYTQMTISGLSETLTKSLCASLSEAGQCFRRLRAFVEDATFSKHSLTVTVAYSNVVSTIATRLSSRLTNETAKSRSIVDLSAMFKRPTIILKFLLSLMEEVQSAPSEMSAMSKVFEFVCSHESHAYWLRDLFLVILVRVTSPWLQAMNSCLGLQLESPTDKTFNADFRIVAWLHAHGENVSGTENIIPSFVSVEDAEIMLETSSTFSILTEYGLSRSPNHQSQVSIPSNLRLNWLFDAKDLQNSLSSLNTVGFAAFAAHSKRLEDAIRTGPFIQSARMCSEKPLLDPYNQIDTLQMRFENMATTLEEIPQTEDHTSNEIIRALETSLDSRPNAHIRTYPISLAPHFSFSPILRSQQRILGKECLRMLFGTYELRKHFSLQHKFHLFGDGVFASRLSQALFSSELSIITGRADYSQTGNYGLRLSERQTWPPGGSELRLALTGILVESFFGFHHSSEKIHKELPGNLSFGIRNLSESEIEAVMDPHSLSAMDFLRLKYVPLAPLNIVFKQEVMEKYDVIFKLLLRVLRLLAVTSQLNPRRGNHLSGGPIALRFYVSASRFMEALSGHFLQNAVTQPWNRFEAQLNEIEGSPDEDASRTNTPISSLRELCAAHEAMLDAILFGLFLRQRQVPMMNLLEEIFTLILRFSRSQQGTARNDGVSFPEEIKGLYDLFCSKVATFITVCHGVSSQLQRRSIKRVASTRGAEMEAEGIESLLLRLNMNGWWT